MNLARRISCLSVGVAGLVAATCPNPAVAAERMVIYENFTATWCGYCPDIGKALNQLVENHPGEVIPLQLHVNDAYSNSYGNSRNSFYGVGGIPDTYGDGVFRRLGGGAAYSQFNSWRANRLATPTDVTIDLEVLPVSGQTYNIVARVGVEEGGVGKDVVVHFVNCLSNYPSISDGRYPNCVRGGWNMGTHSLVPGQTITIEQNVTFDTASWSRQPDINIVAFAQQTGTGLGSEVYNATQLYYPFVESCTHELTEVAITPEAIADDPALQGAKCFDLQVTTTYGDDWTSTDGTISVDGDLYQHALGGNTPLPNLWTTFPGLEFDSFFAAPDFETPGFAEGPDVTNSSMSAIWFDLPASPEGTYTIGRFTVTSGTLLTLSGTTTAANTQGKLLPFSFEAALDFDDCEGDLNGDGLRDQADLGVLLASYGVDDGGDLNGDGNTDQADLGILLSVYNVPCP